MGTSGELLEALSPVVDALERLGVPYFVGGSVASAAHGEFRATNDVDLLADLRIEHAAPLARALEESYYVSLQAIEDAVARRGSFNLIHLETMLKVDVFASPGRPYDAAALGRRVRQPLASGDEASAVHLASPEDVVLAKLEWYRRGGEVSERQWSDVLGVLRVQGASIDGGYLRQWAADLGVEDLLVRALAESADA